MYQYKCQKPPKPEDQNQNLLTEDFWSICTQNTQNNNNKSKCDLLSMIMEGNTV